MTEKKKKSKIKLGDRVKDTVTDFEGTVTAKTMFLNGCVQFEVQPRALHDGKRIESEWIDEQQLERLRKPRTVKPRKTEEPPGGGFRSHPR